ncbi:MAG TPA: hypothetical protein VFB12_33285 [Ktedonobacteraceae bacterium]|nr:hypothetical protein [Ktedonobacteraceae bacterium]
MNTYPSPEARMSALERGKIMQDARIEELSLFMTTRLNDIYDDMQASFKQLSDYHERTENQIDTRFSQVDARFDQVDARFSQIDARFDQVDARFDQIEARLNKVETRLDDMQGLLIQILARLPAQQP